MEVEGFIVRMGGGLREEMTESIAKDEQWSSDGSICCLDGGNRVGAVW